MIELDLDEDNDVTDRIVGTTKGGKDLVIYTDRAGYCRVKFTSGGQLPARLAGRFTDYAIAENHVKAYLSAEADYLRAEALKKAEQEAREAQRAEDKRKAHEEQERLIKDMEARAESRLKATDESAAKASKSAPKTKG